MSTESDAVELPRPFYEDGWARSERPYARALWDFHVALTRPYAPALDGSDLEAYFEAEASKAQEGSPLDVVPAATAHAAYAACDAVGLPADLLAEQVRAARAFGIEARFADNAAINAFIDQWAGSHARLLSRLAGASGSWQLAFADECARGFFWVGRLITLKGDVASGRVFIPESDLDQLSVSLDQLREGRVDENMKRLIWKQIIRAKNAFAQAEPFVHELRRQRASALKRWWLGGLEVLNEIRRREYDVWSEPIRLTARHRLQVRFQARFGRTTFRSR